MPTDPFESLQLPIAPLAPRPAFASALRARIVAALGLEPERTRQMITPYLTSHDAAAALDFYADAFGAVEQMRVVGDGRIGHSEFTIGTARFMLSDEYPEIGVVSPRTLGGATTAMYLEVEDVDVVYERAVAAGAEALRPPADQTHGNRTAVVRDPSGHRWMLSQAIETLTLEEYAERETGWTVTGRDEFDPDA
jgi:PhnB protein